MASREAERKALQRAGYKHRPILCHDDTLKAALMAEGLITDAQLDDDVAINEAASRFLMRHCKIGRILPEQSPPLPPKRDRRPHGSRRHQVTHGPTTPYTPEEIAKLNAQCKEDLLGVKYGPYLTPEKRVMADKLGREGSLGSGPLGVRGLHGVIDVGEPGGAYIKDLPPDWEKRRKRWRVPGREEALRWTWDDDEAERHDDDPMTFGEVSQDAMHGLDSMDTEPEDD
ncbi:hypothetical protein AUC71_02420 [Methyloceanibacter marginalis]|uniref:Uncharacterized protein n=1 Tax=Methyloceanibacter marginalis TaxID=1774971 RepID=A0A1E3W997_9HYPH|nr:hypothetical protein [Methyloceanibacter marginalis]ODS02082.1 hypothetical protein AUC71_02420 [Methyloceanibacter marginalis]